MKKLLKLKEEKCSDIFIHNYAISFVLYGKVSEKWKKLSISFCLMFKWATTWKNSRLFLNVSTSVFIIL